MKTEKIQFVKQDFVINFTEFLREICLSFIQATPKTKNPLEYERKAPINVFLGNAKLI